MKRPRITDTTLRDAHQSLWATRMRTEDMVPILEDLDKVGYFSLEMWGGATFDVCVRYLNEDPWERIRIVKKHVRQTPLQMLLRGQNLVGYTNYPDDVVLSFVDKAAELGIDIFRVFDALNDVRNLNASMRAVKKTGKHLQACVVYTLSPVHTNEHYVETALKLQDMGADTICIKDMAGLISPYVAYELVSLFKEKLNVPVQLHTHYIGGMAIGACLKAVEAGIDVFDACSGPLAFGSSQPPVETLVRALRGTPWDTGYDVHRLFKIANYWEDVRRRCGYERGLTRLTDMMVFDHQVPGGMISNLVIQLEEQRALHKLQEVLVEIPRVREELGYPPLVTPTSQIVGTQAVLNVLSGERYKIVPQEVKDYIRGFYGKPPAPIEKEIKKLVIGNEEPITCRPADLLEWNWEKTRNEIKDLAESEEDYITYAIFPTVSRRFFEHRKKVKDGELESIAAEEQEAVSEKQTAGTLPVNKHSQAQPVGSVQGSEEMMNIHDLKDLIYIVNDTEINELHVETPGLKVNIRKGIAGSHSPEFSDMPKLQKNAQDCLLPADLDKADGCSEKFVEVCAPMVGTFYKSSAPDALPFVDKGSKVQKGDPLCIIEAMKLMNEIESEHIGEVVEILAENGQPVEYGQVLFLIAPEE